MIRKLLDMWDEFLRSIHCAEVASRWNKGFLIIEDDCHIRELFERVCRINHVKCYVSETIREGERMIAAHDDIGVAIIDLHLPDGDAFDLIDRLKTRHHVLPIVYTADPDAAKKARSEHGVVAYVKGEDSFKRVLGLSA